jgi:hypothetical protein
LNPYRTLVLGGSIWESDALDAMQYFILRTPGQPDEVARWQRRGGASYFEPQSGRWIMDPLLAVEIFAGDDWRPIDVADLPPGLPDVNPVARASTRVKERPGSRHRRR